MVSKCANPSCSATFRYLREGTIFHVASEKNSLPQTPTHERFWLCGECSPKMTVISDDSGIHVVLLQDLSEKQTQQRARGMAAGAFPTSSS
ncbi:MAG: hypothetical protein WB523_07745 [Candidatus Sulfotelmatobacter sp.]